MQAYESAIWLAWYRNEKVLITLISWNYRLKVILPKATFLESKISTLVEFTRIMLATTQIPMMLRSWKTESWPWEFAMSGKCWDCIVSETLSLTSTRLQQINYQVSTCSKSYWYPQSSQIHVCCQRMRLYHLPRGVWWHAPSPPQNKKISKNWSSQDMFSFILFKDSEKVQGILS